MNHKYSVDEEYLRHIRVAINLTHRAIETARQCLSDSLVALDLADRLLSPQIDRPREGEPPEEKPAPRGE